MSYFENNNKVTPRTSSKAHGQKTWFFLYFYLLCFRKLILFYVNEKTKLIHTRAVLINVKKKRKHGMTQSLHSGVSNQSVSVQILKK